MGRILAPFLGVVAAATLLSNAVGQERFPCEAFKRNADGSISIVKDVTLPGPNGNGMVPVGQGMSFPAGVDYMGLNLMGLHDKNCR